MMKHLFVYYMYSAVAQTGADKICVQIRLDCDPPSLRSERRPAQAAGPPSPPRDVRLKGEALRKGMSMTMQLGPDSEPGVQPEPEAAPQPQPRGAGRLPARSMVQVVGVEAKTVLVAYASKYGATVGIAERIAERLRLADIDAVSRRAGAVGNLAAYDAVVVGSAVYRGHWLREAASFVRRNRVALAERPLWLFSSGPLRPAPPGGVTEPGAAEEDVEAAGRAREVAEFAGMVHFWDHRVFPGALNRRGLSLSHRLITKLPAARGLFQEGDFRDWDAIDSWAEEIAQQLAAYSQGQD